MKLDREKLNQMSRCLRMSDERHRNQALGWSDADLPQVVSVGADDRDVAERQARGNQKSVQCVILCDSRKYMLQPSGEFTRERLIRECRCVARSHEKARNGAIRGFCGSEREDIFVGNIKPNIF